MPKRLYLSHGDDVFTAEVSGGSVTIAPGDNVVEVERVDERLRARVGPESGAAMTGSAASVGDSIWVTVEGEVFVFEARRSATQDRRGARDHTAFTSPMPATVVRIAVKAGDAVQAGDVLIALEAMKMELPIRAPRDGVVRAVHCHEGDLVQPDQELLELE